MLPLALAISLSLLKEEGKQTEEPNFTFNIIKQRDMLSPRPKSILEYFLVYEWSGTRVEAAALCVCVSSVSDGHPWKLHRESSCTLRK